MIYTKDELTRMLDEMTDLRSRVQGEVTSAPEGKIMVTTRDGRTNYFRNLYDDKGRRVDRQGITRDRPMIARLAIKSYNEGKLELLDKNIEAMNRLIGTYIDPNVEEIVSRMSKRDQKRFSHFYAGNPELLHQKENMTLYDMPARILDLGGNTVNIRKLLDVQVLCREEDRSSASVDMTGLKRSVRQEIMQAWAATPYNKSTLHPERLTVIADGGLKVRTRLEALGVEKLNKFKVPFRYEQVIWFDDRSVAPDIIILCADGSIIIWELCGMMGKKGYREKHIRKRALYENNGFSQWRGNLILTYAEGSEYNSDAIESIIRNDILPRL